MKPFIVYYFLFLLFAGACQSSTQSTRESTEEHSLLKSQKPDSMFVSKDKPDKRADNINFSDYVSLIPPLDLPLHFDCDKNELTAVDFNNNDTIDKFIPKGAVINGKLYENDKKTGIIYSFSADIMLPFLYEYDKKGQLVRIFQFYKLQDCIGNYEGDEHQTYTQINIAKDLNIHKEIITVKCKKSGGNLACDTIRENSVLSFIHE